MANKVETVFTGDDSDLQKTFDKVGSGAKDMANNVGRASKDMARSTDLAQTNIADRVDSSEKRFRGMGDAINGTGDIMEGFRTGNVALLAMGMADMAGAMTDFLIPALNTLKNAIVTGLGSAFTFIMAHPLILAIAIGGAIIVALIVLEKKFGLVTKAVRGLGDIFSAIWPGIKAVINGIIGGLEFIANASIDTLNAPIRLLNKLPGPNLPTAPRVSLPRLHSGGVVSGPGEQLAILQQGERVIPKGGGGGGPTTIVVRIGDREIGRVVADALRQNKLIGVT